MIKSVSAIVSICVGLLLIVVLLKTLGANIQLPAFLK